tara:strand:+ start:137 stop:379 length:243 start_codon:yes stop_codon:yes gene_type:complete
MALTERQEISHRDVLSDGQIEVRIDTVIERDGEEISRAFWRETIYPGQDVSDRDPLIQRIARAEHTPAVVAAYKLAQANL